VQNVVVPFLPTGVTAEHRRKAADLMTVSLALLVGVVGIINTMLMSTTERFVEFGVLRTNGWSRANVLSLVTIESAYLGLMSGVVGCLMAFTLTRLANAFLSGGLSLQFSPRLVAIGLILSVVMGTLGGLYPAWKASRLVPMDAIRLGSH
jgi:putative ABC transport system permease protein